MGIEKGSAAGHAHAAAAQRHGAAGKAGAGQAAPHGDFLALMAALEDGAGLADGDGMALLPGADPAEGPRGRRQRGAALADALPADAAALALLQSAPAAAAITPAQPQPVAAAAAPAVQADGGKPVVGADLAKLADKGQGLQAGPPAAHTAPDTAAPPATAAGDPRTAPQYASVFEQLQQHLAAREQAAPESALRQASAAAAQAALPRDMREMARAERGGLQPLAGAARADAQAALPATELAAVGSSAAARSGGQDAGDGAGRHGASHGGAGWAAPDFTPTVQYDAALANLDPSAQADTAFDRQLADQLRHWASQGVRSAELTVGTSEPVQVRIALDGNEAQVQFRAEHAATREMLAGSVDQLRDLLGAQGLVLSGVSVGAHEAGGGRGHAGDGAAAAPAPRPAAARPEATAEAVATAPRRGAGALDLYV
jgi:flagellar hook-length control protein FliK